MKTKLLSPIRAGLLVTVLLCATTAETCDSSNIATGFKIGLGASKPFVTSLVTSHTITQAQADLANQDLTDGVNVIANTEDCLKSAKLYEGGKRRVENAACYFQASQGLRTILARHNFDGNERLSQLSTIMSGAIEAFEAYYTTVNTGPEVTGPSGGITHVGADGINGKNAEKELERALKQAKKDLEKLQKGE